MRYETSNYAVHSIYIGRIETKHDCLKKLYKTVKTISNEFLTVGQAIEKARRVNSTTRYVKLVLVCVRNADEAERRLQTSDAGVRTVRCMVGEV